MQFLERLENRLESRKREGAYRSLKTNPTLIDFVSNDYLGLARDPRLHDRVRELEKDFSQSNPRAALHGSTGSRLLSGHSELADRLEKRIAAFHKTESALIFNSGYDANLGLLSVLLQEGDIALYDESIHASAHDGIRLGRAQSFAFRHCDLEHLEQRLNRLKTSNNTWIIVESLYSMDGDLAPLTSLCDLADRYGAHLLVDEAHATGLYGEKGEGLVCSLGLSHRVFARIHTFGKALGVHGAAVVGPRVLRELLINFSRPFIYSTALPPHSLLAIHASYDFISEMQNERRRLQGLIAHFAHEAVKIGDPGLVATPGLIQRWIIPGNEQARAAQLRAQTKGFDVRAILNPTVPSREERLRICLHHFNTEDQITGLLEAIRP